MLRSNADLHRLANLLVRQAEWNAALDQISGGRPGIHESRLRRFLHALVIEFDGFHPSGNQR